MSKKEKSFSIRYTRVDGDYGAIFRKIVKNEIKKVMDAKGVVSYNLDEVLSKYITGDKGYEYDQGR